MPTRFAAKEAVIKAHHNRRLTYHSIAIHNRSSKLRDPSDIVEGSKAPYAVVISESGSWEDGQEVKLSISHDGDYATAVCLAYEPNPSEPNKVSTQWEETRDISG
jgi:phosphopantetheinyl transferase (holo-ACP synthase)